MRLVDEAAPGGAGLVLPRALCPNTAGRRDEQDAKTAMFGNFGASAEAAESGAAYHRTVVPGAAALDDHAAVAGPRRVFHVAVLVIVRIVDVLTPLPRIPVHVVKAPIVQLLLAHRMRSSAGINVVPSV